MNDREEFMKELFQDMAIAQEDLDGLKGNIMEQVRSSPVDFQAKLQTQRRKLGLIFLSGISTLSVIFFLMFRFFGSWVSTWANSVWEWLLGYVPILGGLLLPWEWLGLGKAWTIFKHLLLGYEIFWGQYGLAVIGILMAWVVFDSLRDKVLTKQ